MDENQLPTSADVDQILENKEADSVEAQLNLSPEEAALAAKLVPFLAAKANAAADSITQTSWKSRWQICVMRIRHMSRARWRLFAKA